MNVELTTSTPETAVHNQVFYTTGRLNTHIQWRSKWAFIYYTYCNNSRLYDSNAARGIDRAKVQSQSTYIKKTLWSKIQQRSVHTGQNSGRQISAKSKASRIQGWTQTGGKQTENGREEGQGLNMQVKSHRWNQSDNQRDGKTQQAKSTSNRTEHVFQNKIGNTTLNTEPCTCRMLNQRVCA